LRQTEIPAKEKVGGTRCSFAYGAGDTQRFTLQMFMQLLAAQQAGNMIETHEHPG
jgi:hypothetical protein